MKKKIDLKKVSQNLEKCKKFVLDKLDSQINDLESKSTSKRYNKKINDILFK